MNLDQLALWYLAGLSLYHLWTGLISYFAPERAMKFYRGFYGADPVERRHLLLILRPWGALAIFAGLAGFAAVWRPPCRHWIEAAMLLLLALRIGYRLGLRRELHEISKITPRRNAISLAMLFGGAALLAADLLANADFQL